MKKTVKILFDLSVFRSGNDRNANRSGIFFVAYNIFINFLKNPDMDVYAYVDPQDKRKVNIFLKTMPTELYSKIKFPNAYRKSDRLKIILETLNEKIRFATNPLLKIILRASRKLLYITDKILCRMVKTKVGVYDKTYLDGIDCFFSPVFAIPDFIFNDQRVVKFTFLHDVICLKFPHYFPVLNYSFWYKDLIRQLNRRDYYFTNSETTRNDFLELFPINPEHIVTSYVSSAIEFNRVLDETVIDKVRKKYNVPQGKKYILSLCSLEPRKNLIFSIKGFIHFVKTENIKDIVFVLGGAQWDNFVDILEKELGSLAEYDDLIVRGGYINDEDLAALYSGSLFFVYTSIYEGFGMPVLEAMSCGVPVIASNVSSIPEVTGDAAIKINPYDQKAYDEALGTLYYDEDKRVELSKQGLLRKEKFQWDKIVAVMVSEIKKRCGVSYE